VTARTILHVDMDAFFVACEVRRDPTLKDKPVIVGGSGERGVVAAASYEARTYGIHSAMPSVRAKRLCPHALFLRGDHALYSEVSEQVHEIFRSVTELVEPISLDEAFLDVTGARRRLGDGAAIAGLIRSEVDRTLELACSVGVASTKLVAKLASEAAKPRAGPDGVRPGRGVLVVPLEEELGFLHAHPVQALWGVGPATLDRLQRLGVTTVRDLALLPEQSLVAALGRANGEHLHRLANGVDDRPVDPGRPLKSVGHEETFAADHHSHVTLDRELVRLCDSVASRLRAAGRRARTITVKVRFHDFRTITGSSTLPHPIDTGPEVTHAASGLLHEIDVDAGVRLLGVSASGLTAGDAEQLSLSVGDEPEPAWGPATEAVDAIRRRFGAEAIAPASLAGPAGVRVARRGAQQWGPDSRPHDPPPHDSEQRST
jgi:DNA polymerase-4